MHTTQIRSGIFGRADDVRMSRCERLRVNVYMQDGELIAEFLCRALASIRSGIALAGHGAGSLARGVKAMFVRPVKH